jgi:hypothetical protein
MSDVLVVGDGRLQIVCVPQGTGATTLVVETALCTQGAAQNRNTGGCLTIASRPRVWNCSSVWLKVGVPAATVFSNTPTVPACGLVASLPCHDFFRRNTSEKVAVHCHCMVFFFLRIVCDVIGDTIS